MKFCADLTLIVLAFFLGAIFSQVMIKNETVGVSTKQIERNRR